LVVSFHEGLGQASATLRPRRHRACVLRNA